MASADLHKEPALAYHDDAASTTTTSSTHAAYAQFEIIDQAFPQRRRFPAFPWRPLLALVPSFLTNAPPTNSNADRPTAWLDGLRGVCACMVFNTHLSQILCKCLGTGFGLPDETPNLLKLPILSLSYAGFFAVCVFFIISGYALSLQPVRRMNAVQAQHASAGRTLASQILRRPIRLLVPSWASTMLAFGLIQMGVVAAVQKLGSESAVLDGREEQYSVYEPLDLGFWAQVWDLIKENTHLLYLWDQAHADSKYNAALWTIPLELRSSLLLYVLHAALSFVKSMPARVGLAASMIPLAMHYNILDIPMFLTGYVLCELDYQRLSKGVKPGRVQVATFTALLVLGLYVSSIPGQRANETPGFRILSEINPLGQYSAVYFWQAVGAAMVFAAISRLSFVSRLFSLPLARYMGQISFAFYLVHAPIVAVVGTVIFHQAWTVTGTEHVIWQALGFSIGYCITILAVICVADVFSRLVDEKSIVLSKQINKAVLPERADSEQGVGLTLR